MKIPFKKTPPLYIYDELKMEYTPFKPSNKMKVILGIVTFLWIVFIIAFFIKPTTKVFINNETVLKEQVSEYYLDSLFNDYRKRADLYLQRDLWEETPLTGEMLAFCARNAYDSTGILLPVELALTQAQIESSMGLKGRSPKNNPYNVGEYDSGTVMWFNSTIEGVQAYYYLICTQYLSCRNLNDLFIEFKNCDGYRYATSNYEPVIRDQYNYIKEWIDGKLLKNKEKKKRILE